MEIFIIGYVLGCISVIAIWIFINSRGKTGTTGTLKERVDTNNTDIRQGIDRLRDNNLESGKIIDEAKDTASEGLKTIDNTRKSVSEIIAASKRKRNTDD